MVMMPGTHGEGDDVSCSQGSRHLSLSLSLAALDDEGRKSYCVSLLI
jgi:hypothetical protein